MTADELKKALRAQPFRCFALRTVGGVTLRVEHPEFVALSPGGRTIAVYSTDANAFEILDTLMIEALVFTGEGGADEKRRSA